jgi:hypothetical protein
LTFLNSCEKETKTEETTWEIDGTTWEGEYDGIFGDDHGEAVITLSFIGDQVKINAKLKWNGDPETVKLTGHYTYQKEKITIYVSWENDYEWIGVYDDGVWKGTVEKNTMTIGILGKFVTFIKQ